MTQAAHEVMAAAADPAFAVEPAALAGEEALPPAWSGAGQAYDDDEPPAACDPDRHGTGADPVSGWSWDRIGQMSRAYHRTQGMGRWVPAGSGTGLSAASRGERRGRTRRQPRVGTAEGCGRPRPGRRCRAHRKRSPTGAGAYRVRRSPAFPTSRRSPQRRSARCAAYVGHARSVRPRPGTRSFIALTPRKRSLATSSGMRSGSRCAAGRRRTYVRPGERSALTTEVGKGDADEVTVSYDLPGRWTAEDGELSIGEDAAPSDPYPTIHDPASPRAPAMLATVRAHGDSIEVRLPFEEPPVVLPRRTAVLVPEADCPEPASAADRAPRGCPRRGAGGGRDRADPAGGLERATQ